MVRATHIRRRHNDKQTKRGLGVIFSNSDAICSCFYGGENNSWKDFITSHRCFILSALYESVLIYPPICGSFWPEFHVYATQSTPNPIIVIQNSETAAPNLLTAPVTCSHSPLLCLQPSLSFSCSVDVWMSPLWFGHRWNGKLNRRESRVILSRMWYGTLTVKILGQVASIAVLWRRKNKSFSNGLTTFPKRIWPILDFSGLFLAKIPQIWSSKTFCF